MSRRYRSSRIGTSRLSQWWPVLLSLLVVLVPTVCVLWFMTEAVENRRLVVHRALADADYTVAQDRLENYWKVQALYLENLIGKYESLSEAFQRAILEKQADSVVFFRDDGQLAYPVTAHKPQISDAEQKIDWSRLERLEYQQQDLATAANTYAEIAEAHGDPLKKESFDANLAARTLTAQARCLVKMGSTDVAIEVLLEMLNRHQLKQAVDPEGRLILATVELRLLELIKDHNDAVFQRVSRQLIKLLNDYGNTQLAAPQRRFLMRRVQEILPVKAEFPTLEAEEIAAEFVEANPRPSKDNVIRLTQSPGLWQLASTNAQVYAIFRTESILSMSKEVISERKLKSGADIKPIPPGIFSSEDSVLHTVEAGRFLPGWRLSRSVNVEGKQAIVSDTQIVAYFWTGLLVIFAMSIFALIIAGSFRRQLRLTRLRNDLVATVSHELKTPLSSIRLLVDTLLDEQKLDEQKVREYLELMSKENNRLSRLIDSFLTFSRMERNKHAFEFSKVRLTDVIDAAEEVVHERFHTPECQFDVQKESGLPAVEADADALVTTVLNLLDNAYKYTTDEKHIVLRAYAENGNVCLEVEDNGIGLSRVASKKVFKRFYQVDRRVSRTTGGVGLGLSIVQFIVEAHGATVDVKSRPGEGSTFTVTFPKIPEKTETKEA